MAPGAAAGVKMPAPEPVVGSVHVRYNHYNSAFEIVDGRLLFEVVDVEYCISFVFKGAWRARLYSAADGSMCARVDGLAPSTDEGRENPQICFGFDGLEPGGAYTLSVEEDAAAEEAAGPRKTYKGAEKDDAAASGASRLTDELKALSTDELRDGSERYKALKEARDLEDVLFSG